MSNQSPAQIAANWAARLGASTTKITEGINGVTVAPGAAAARQKAVWVQNTTAAADKWATNVASITVDEWKRSMLEKGVPRIGQGANASVDKFTTFMSNLLPHIDRIKSQLPPRGTLDQNIERSARMIRGMATFTNK